MLKKLIRPRITLKVRDDGEGRVREEEEEKNQPLIWDGGSKRSRRDVVLDLGWSALENWVLKKVLHQLEDIACDL